MKIVIRDILTKIGITLGSLSFGLFLTAEIRAWWVIAPKGILCENPDFGVMWNLDSMLPMQYRLMSYRAGAGDYRDLGFTLPAAALLVLGLTLGIGLGVRFLEEALRRRNHRRSTPGVPACH